MLRMVEVERLGSVADLVIAEESRPDPGPRQVRVRVKTAGLNPVDWKMIEIPGLWQMFDANVSLPIGNGSDFAGIIDAVGENVSDWKPGDAVLGRNTFNGQADYVVAEADDIVAKPAELSWVQAGGLNLVARAATASVRSVAPSPGETVLVSAASGSVGGLAAQLAMRAGARVIGTSGLARHEYLLSLGVTPVPYEGSVSELVERIRAVAPDGIDAVIDAQGKETLEAAVQLGVDPNRINSIVDYEYAPQIGAHMLGADSATRADVATIAELIVTGELAFPIESVYPLEQVATAYEQLKQGHAHGKIVLEL